MALVHPGKPRAVSFAPKTKVAKEMHPAVGLVFAFMIMLAMVFVVHNVFNFFI